MAHPRDRLRPGEKIILDTRPHWWYFARPTGLLLVSILIAIVVLVSSSNLEENSIETDVAEDAVEFTNRGTDFGIGANFGSALQILSSFLIIIAIVLLAVTIVTWYFTHFFVSTQRVVLRSGVLNREGVEIPIDRVNTVFFEQNFVERFVGAGDVLVESAGESGVQRFFDIANPLAVKERMRKQIDASHKKKTAAVPAPAPAVPAAAPTAKIVSITDQIRELNDLRNQEIITQEEFDSKKAELLSRI